MKAYDTFLKRFPHHPEASNVLMKKGLICENAGDRAQAIKAYTAFLARFPNDAQATNVRTRRNLLLQQEKKTRS